MDESYFVVSDVHLGAEDCCKEEFEHFLEWLAGSRNGGKLSVQTQQGKRILTPPTTLILLGDMLDSGFPAYTSEAACCATARLSSASSSI